MSSPFRACLHLGFGVLIVAFTGCGRKLANEDNAGQQEDRNAIWKQGENFLQARNYESAVAEFTRLVDNSSQATSLHNQDEYFLWALYSRGSAYLESNLPEKAIEDFTTFLRLQPTYANVLYKRGLAYVRIGFPDIAIADFDAALEARPDDYAAHLERGRAYLKLDEFQRAMEDCTQSIRLQPDNPEAFRIRGVAYFERREYALAIANLEQSKMQGAKVADIGPLLSKAYFQRSKQLQTAGDIAKAQEMLAEAQKLDPQIPDLVAQDRTSTQPTSGSTFPSNASNVHAKPLPTGEIAISASADEHLRAGNDFYKAGDFEAAHNEFTEVIRLQPNRVEAYDRRAALWHERKFPDIALLDILRAIRLGGYTADRLRLKAQVLLDVGDEYGALDSATEILRRGPIDTEALRIRGTAFLQLNKFDQAIQDLSLAMEKAPSLKNQIATLLANAHRGRGESLKSAGKVNQAQTDFAKAIELGWTGEDDRL